MKKRTIDGHEAIFLHQNMRLMYVLPWFLSFCVLLWQLMASHASIEELWCGRVPKVLFEYVLNISKSLYLQTDLYWNLTHAQLHPYPNG